MEGVFPFTRNVAFVKLWFLGNLMQTSRALFIVEWIILKSNVNCTWMNNLSASLIKFHRIVSSILYSKYIINIRSQSRVQIVTYKYWNIEIYILYTLLIKSYKYMYIFLRIKRFKIVHADTFYIITMMGIKLLKRL